MKHRRNLLVRIGVYSKLSGAAIVKQVNNSQVFISSQSKPHSSTCRLFILKSYSHILGKRICEVSFIYISILRNHIFVFPIELMTWCTFGALFLIMQNRTNFGTWWFFVTFGYYYGESWIWHYCGGRIESSNHTTEISFAVKVFSKFNSSFHMYFQLFVYASHGKMMLRYVDDCFYEDCK